MNFIFKALIILAPVNLMDVGIYLLKNCDERFEISKQDILSKMIIVPHNQHFISLKMLQYIYIYIYIFFAS